MTIANDPMSNEEQAIFRSNEPTASDVLRQLHELNMLLVRSKINVKRDHHFGEQEDICDCNDEEELTPVKGQGRVLATLSMWRHKRDGVSIRDLSIIMGANRKALAKLVDKLESKSLVKRMTDLGDADGAKVKLTKSGMRTAWDICHRYSSEGVEFFDCLSNEELSQLSSLLNRVISNAEEIVPDSRIKERRNAMREYLHLNHLNREDSDA